MMGEKTYILRTCAADGSSSHGFVWPDNGPVEAPDWDPKAECGHGLHGLLLGRGDGGLLDWSDDARWIVAEVDADTVVDLYGKVKFPRAEVVYCGDRGGATNYLMDCGAIGVAGATLTAGENGIATAGDYGTATAGSHGTATAGEYGTATAGDYGTATAGENGIVTAGENGIATAGDYGTATAGENGIATAGDYGTATAGYGGTATAGYGGTATAGYGGTATAGSHGTATAGEYGTATAGSHGTATAGDYGTATAGDYGTATAGSRGTATAGENGIIVVTYWDASASRQRVAVGYVGENGIARDVPYRVSNGQLVEAKAEGSLA